MNIRGNGWLFHSESKLSSEGFSSFLQVSFPFYFTYSEFSNDKLTFRWLKLSRGKPAWITKDKCGE